MRKVPFLAALILMLAAICLSSTVQAEGPLISRPARLDDRAALRAQIESELILRKARMKAIEQELQRQAERYDEMAKHKMELAKIADTKADAARDAAREKALKAQYAAANAGPKPAAKGAKGKGKDAKDADAKGDAKAADGGKDAGDAKAAKKIDPMLTQNYLVMRLRDEARQLGDRINYLESLLLRL